MMHLDDKDYSILSILEENSRLSTQAISKKTLIPITTVHHRIKKLMKNRVIKGYTIIKDELLLGNIISAYVLANVKYPDNKKPKTFQEVISTRIKSYEEARSVKILAGKSDIIVFVRVKSMNHLNDFILKKLRTIKGIDKTETLVVMKEI